MTRLNVSVEWLEPNPWNPNVMTPDIFEALKVDVIAGDYDPLVVSPKNVFYANPDLPVDRYVIVDGQQRWSAAVEGDVGYVDVDVKPITDADARSYCYRKNRERGQLDPVKEGSLFELDVKELGSEEAVAERYGRSRSYVAGRRRLLKLAEPVKQLYREPEKILVELKKDEIAAGIVEENPEEEYTEQEMTEMVDAVLDVNKFVPRGTLTTSHMEAIAGLPEEAQKQVATRILEENLTVRDTEEVVRLYHENVARRKRFEEALERAVQKTCPECGAPPKDFESYSVWNREGQSKGYHEDRFDCSQCYNDWDFMVNYVPPEEKAEKESKERAKRMREIQANPSYVRRVETTEQIGKRVRPWILRKIKQLNGVEKIELTGVRAGKRVMIDYPGTFGSQLNFRVGESEKLEESWTRWENVFAFDMEDKDYKTLNERCKLDIVHNEASPERRAEIHWFLDEIVNTEMDPFLPEDPEQVRKILSRYGELQEDEG